MAKQLFLNDSARPVVCLLVYVLDKNRPQGTLCPQKNFGADSNPGSTVDGETGDSKLMSGAHSVELMARRRRIEGSKGEVFCVALPKLPYLDVEPLSYGEVFCAGKDGRTFATVPVRCPYLSVAKSAR
jgi:hypothetical protein